LRRECGMGDRKGKEVMDNDEAMMLQIRDLDAEEASSGSGSSSSSSSGSSSLSGSADVTEHALFLEPISAANVGSLLRFFQSMFFDSWITISYLYKFREHAGVCDYLCNELYKFQERDVEKYIPQLWYAPLISAKCNAKLTICHRYDMCMTAPCC
jgi:hypothetical protein